MTAELVDFSWNAVVLDNPSQELEELLLRMQNFENLGMLVDSKKFTWGPLVRKAHTLLLKHWKANDNNVTIGGVAYTHVSVEASSLQLLRA
jgi:hypothetical protein